MNPKVARNLRKVAGAKTDPIDAYLLAKLGRFEVAELRRLEPDSPRVQELKTLTRDQDALVQMQTRLINQLTACWHRNTIPSPCNCSPKSHELRNEIVAELIVW